MSVTSYQEQLAANNVVHLEDYLAAKQAQAAALAQEIAIGDDQQVRDIISNIIAHAARANFHVVQPGEVAVARESFVVQPEQPSHAIIGASALNLALGYESRKSNVKDSEL